MNATSFWQCFFFVKLQHSSDSLNSSYDVIATMYVVRYLKLFQYSAFSKQRIIIFLPFSVIGSLLNLDFAVNMETWRLMGLAFYLPLENWNIVWLMSRKCLNLTLPSLESRNIPSQNISHCIMWLILSMMLNEKCRKFQKFQPKNNY